MKKKQSKLVSRLQQTKYEFSTIILYTFSFTCIIALHLEVELSILLFEFFITASAQLFD